MRLTTLLLTLAGVTTTGCLSNVGGDQCTSERCKDDGDGSGSGSGSATTADCAEPEVRTTPVTIRSDADFAALPKKCWSLDATLRVEGPSVASLEKLGDLIDVNDLELVDTGLTTIDTKQTVKVYGSLLVSGNTKLTGLDKLTVSKWTGPTVEGAFSVAYIVRNNAVLANVNGLKYIAQVDRELTFANNPKLAALDFSELARVGGALTITGTGATSIGLSDLASVASIEIASNPQLTTVGGLAATVILGNFTLRGNAKLAQVGTMSSLTQISGNLVVDDNDALTDLAGLTGSMQRIGGTVTISGNQLLTGLGQLSHLAQGIGATVSITNNPALGYCKAVEVDHCVASGTVTITGNLNQNNCNCWCGQ